MTVVAAQAHKWEFKASFRRHAFGWRSQPAVQRIREAVAEIKKVARHDRVLAADGAVTLLERISPALEQVDSSSGAMGTAVNRAIAEIIPIIASAPADHNTREAWLERLWAAHEADDMPYIELLGDHWGDLCASKDTASAWADRLVSTTRLALSPDRRVSGHFHGTSACLSALFHAERYEELVNILKVDTIWPYKCWAVRALAAMGKKSEALQYAESCRGRSTSDEQLDAMCEDILLSSGLAEEAYERYALRANRRGTYLATFKAVAKKYPHKSPRQLLDDLVKTTPGDEGKWFAAAKEAGLYDEALALAAVTPCDPKTLTRAADALSDGHPDFALGAGLLALHWLVKGYGYEITGADVWHAYSRTMAAAAKTGRTAEVRQRVTQIVEGEGPGGFVTRILHTELGHL